MNYEEDLELITVNVCVCVCKKTPPKKQRFEVKDSKVFISAVARLA